MSGDFNAYAKVAGIEMPKPGFTGKTPEESKDQALLDIQRLINDEQFDPEVPDESYMKVMMEYVQGDEFEELDEEIQKRFYEFIQKLRALLDETLAQAEQGGEQGGMPGATPGEAPGAPAGATPEAQPPQPAQGQAML